MNTRKTMLAMIAFAACASMATASATAAENGTWTRKETANGQMLFTDVSDAPGLAFFCTNGGKLSAMVNLDGGDIAEKIARQSRRVRSKIATLSIEGREDTRADWHYFPATQLAQPVSNSVERKLYNAAVTGSAIGLELSYMENPHISPPPLNDDFKAFATTCSATNGA
nr:hypothetical protein [uncultured Hyphomonas sp.]